MAYATLAHVQLRCPQRPIGTATHPSIDDVAIFLDDAAAELDGLLRGAGYQLPVPATATGALAWLRKANALGAAVAVEGAAPTGKPDQGKQLQAEWLRAQQQLVGGPIELDAPRNAAESYARGRSREDLGMAPARFAGDVEV